MPLEWIDSDGVPEISGAAWHTEGEPPLIRLHLWPHRSLPKRGFVLFIGVTFLLCLMPLAAALGTPVLWGLLPFVLGTLGLTMAMLEKSYRDGEILEELALWSDHAEITRQSRRGAPQRWEANPHWVRLALHRTGGPVPDYLTLHGGGREVELGAFLTAEERVALHGTLQSLWPQIVASAASKGSEGL